MTVCVSVNPFCEANQELNLTELVSSLSLYSNYYLSASFAQPIKSGIVWVSLFFVCIWAFLFCLGTFWVRLAIIVSILLAQDPLLGGIEPYDPGLKLNFVFKIFLYRILFPSLHKGHYWSESRTRGHISNQDMLMVSTDR